MVRRGRLAIVLGACLALAVAAAGLAARWWTTPGAGAAQVLIIEPGQHVSQIGETLARAGLIDSPALFAWQSRLRGVAGRLRAGEYEFPARLSPAGIVALLISGRVLLHPVTLVEGRTVVDAVATLHEADFLRPTMFLKSGGSNRPELPNPTRMPLEGLLFPDTYKVPRGTTDVEVLDMARTRMDVQIRDVWAHRADGLPLKSPYEAIILASIIEKETGNPLERAHIAAVFINRLRQGMRLQTDPTVIYGLGDRYEGVLHKKDLLLDTPWNTYTRKGLPPTPIALPGLASLTAAVHPTASADLYFVASGQGDGRHTFSATLKAHNAAVADYLARLRHKESVR